MKVRGKSLWHQTVCASLASAMLASSASALPDDRKSLPTKLLQRAGEMPELSGSVMLRDHDNPRTVYVGPASRKAQGGSFRYLNYAIECSKLKSMYDLTFYMPKGENVDYTAIAKAGTVSPFFDAHFGNSVRNSTLLAQIADSIGKIGELKEKNVEAYGRYSSAKAAYDLAMKELTAAQAAVDSMTAAITDAQKLVSIAQTPDQLASAREALASARATYDSQIGARNDRLRNAILELSTTRGPYAASKAAIEPILEDEVGLKTRAEAIAAVYTMIQANSLAAFTASEATTMKYSTQPIGRIQAAYTLWDAEQTKLATAIAEVTPAAYDVVPLPLTNVRIETGSTETVTKSVDGSPTGALPDSLNTIVRSTGTAAAVEGSTQPTSLPTFTNEKGVAIRQNVSKPATTGGLFQSVVTQGAFCMETQGGTDAEISIPLATGKKARLPMRVFTPRSAAIQQPVSINYQYYVKADPIDIKCQLEVSRFNSYSRSSGTSGFLFWRKSWDDTQRNTVRNSGVACDVKDNPNLINEDEKVAWRQEMIQKMSQEMMAEYVLQFADRWDVIKDKPVNVPESSYALVGGSMWTVCNFSQYCQIANVVWKSADALFGGQAGGTSTVDNLSGTITRQYREDGYRLSQGSSALNIEISVQGSN